MSMFGYDAGIAPDVRNIITAARGGVPPRMPIYEHLINVDFMEKLYGSPFGQLAQSGKREDLDEFFRIYCGFYKAMGYDHVSFECCVSAIMPGNGALGAHKPGCIKTREDLKRYPWHELTRRYFDAFAPQFEAFGRALPEGMLGIGGVGNGIFECVQDITGYINLCYMSHDDPELYAELFARVAHAIDDIWAQFLPRFGGLYGVCRMGDDMGFRTATLLPPADIVGHIVPGIARVVARAHAAGKPFLLHSCGCLFDVMDDLIGTGIDAKHSNEDQIAPFSEWMERYGSRIALFGGIDLNILCLEKPDTVRAAVRELAAMARARGTGFALGSGNSIPDYVPVEGYLAMVQQANELRS